MNTCDCANTCEAYQECTTVGNDHTCGCPDCYEGPECTNRVKRYVDNGDNLLIIIVITTRVKTQSISMAVDALLMNASLIFVAADVIILAHRLICA